MRHSFVSLVAGSCLLAACGSDPAPDPSAIMDDTGASTGEDDSSSGASDPMTEMEDEERLDVPAVEEMTCQKIDFLFVIDNSSSMEDEQQRLIDGFPGFMQGVQETIEAFEADPPAKKPRRRLSKLLSSTKTKAVYLTVLSPLARLGAMRLRTVLAIKNQCAVCMDQGIGLTIAR